MSGEHTPHSHYLTFLFFFFPLLTAKTISSLLSFTFSFYPSPLPRILIEVEAEIYDKRNCTVAFSVWFCQIRLEAPSPLSNTS